MVSLLPFRSRKLWKIAQGLSEEAQCIQGAILNSTSWLLCSSGSTLTGGRISSSHQFVSLLVYLFAKFGALNRRINEIRSSKNRSGLLSQVQPPRFSFLPIIWLSDLSPMLSRASRTIMDISPHASSVVFASWPRAIKRPHHHTLDRTWKILLKNIIWECDHLDIYI